MPSRFWGDVTIFGVRVSFVSNTPDALRAAQSIFAKWDDPGSPMPRKSIYIVLNVRNGVTGNCSSIAGRRLTIMRDGIALRGDADRGRGVCTFPAGSMDGAAFGEAVHTIVLFLVAHTGRIPVHASAFMLGEKAIVLAGRSGAGKSSLALAANRAGLAVMSDDTVFVQLEPSFRIWALPEAIHVYDRDAPAEVGSGFRFRAGRLKKAIPIARPRHGADRALLCVIAHGSEVLLEEVDSDATVRMLTQDPEPGFEFYDERSGAAVRAIAAGGCWRLTVSHDPDKAIAKLIGTLSDGPAPPSHAGGEP